MKIIHSALRLHKHKHTGKLLAHKHTSYRVLFLLMLLPVVLIPLVGQFVAGAAEYDVTATVPAPMPAGAPVITAPTQGWTTTASQVSVTGECPVILPAVVIELRSNDELAGSAVCSAAGKFSLVISLGIGTHALRATVVTITGQTGESSEVVTVTRTEPTPRMAQSKTPPAAGFSTGSQGMIAQAGLLAPRIMTSASYLIMTADMQVAWRASVVDGTPPYDVRIDWGDGTDDTYEVSDSTEQIFRHKYTSAVSYTVSVTVRDSAGETAVYQTVAATYKTTPLILDRFDTTPFSLAVFVQRHIWQVYLGVLFGLVFLWYLEHGRHIVTHLATGHRRHKHRGSHR